MTVSAGTRWFTNSAPSRSFQHELWAFDPTAYYRHLQGEMLRSSAARYNQLIDDMRNDIVRVPPFFFVARRVIDLDRRREASMEQIRDLTPAERVNARARIAENSLTVAWVDKIAEPALRQLSFRARTSCGRRTAACCRRSG